MIKELIFNEPYNEVAVRTTLGMLNRFPEARPQRIHLQFASFPSTVFVIDGVDTEHFIAQANKIQEMISKK